MSDLINKIADANQTLADLTGSVAGKREAANRALVDLQNARDAQRLAGVAVRAAQTSLTDADGAVADAQRTFDELARGAYKQGNTQNSMSNLVSSDNPDSILDRASVIDRLTRNQQDVIDRLRVARNDKANRAAAAEASQRQADRSARSADDRKGGAESAISQALDAVKGQQQRRDTLVQARDDAQRALDTMRAAAGQPVTPVPVPDAGGSTAPPQGGSTTDGQGAPTEQAPSTQTAPDQSGTDQSGRQPASAGTDQGARDAAMRAAGEAAAKLAVDGTQQILQKLVAAISGGSHTDLNGGGGWGSSDPGSGAGQGGSGTTGQTGGTVQPGITGPAAVEIVVNRAMSQLGVTYAWGGGDANGPTQGIRDGGVADSYGDYNKVGFDCSGLMVYAFAGVGVSLPHYTGYQYTAGDQVPLSQMQRGDMIFYGPNASEHVSMYLGNNQMIEAPESGDVVKVSPLRTSGAMPYVVRME